MEIVYVVSDGQIIQTPTAVVGQVESEGNISVPRIIPPPLAVEISTGFMLVLHKHKHSVVSESHQYSVSFCG
jgi:hypothetical protein